MMRKLLAILLTFTLLLCAGCNTPEQKEFTPTTKSDVCTIGLSFDSFVIERWTRDRDIFVSTANELGAEVNVQSAGGDVDLQISHIKYFIEIGVDAIVIITADANALTDVLKEAKSKDIPVICYDRLGPWRDFTGLRNELNYVMTNDGARLLGTIKKPMTIEEVYAAKG